MKQSFIILKIFLLGIVASVNALELGYGFDGPNLDNPAGWHRESPLELAIERNDFNEVKKIIKSSIKSIEIKAAMNIAGRKGKIEIARQLIASFAYARKKKQLNCLLAGASLCNQVEMAKFALERGADIESKTPCNTPLLWATLLNSKQTICYLIEQGADRNGRAHVENSPYPPQTPLSMALSKKALDTAHVILTTITPDERKRILTAVCGLKFGYFKKGYQFPKDIRHVITRILITQFAHEHVADLDTICNTAYRIGPDYELSELNTQTPSSWNDLYKNKDVLYPAIESNFRRILGPQKNAESESQEPKNKKQKKEKKKKVKIDPGY